MYGGLCIIQMHQGASYPRLIVEYENAVKKLVEGFSLIPILLLLDN